MVRADAAQLPAVRQVEGVTPCRVTSSAVSIPGVEPNTPRPPDWRMCQCVFAYVCVAVPGWAGGTETVFINSTNVHVSRIFDN